MAKLKTTISNMKIELKAVITAHWWLIDTNYVKSLYYLLWCKVKKKKNVWLSYKKVLPISLVTLEFYGYISQATENPWGSSLADFQSTFREKFSNQEIFNGAGSLGKTSG